MNIHSLRDLINELEDLAEEFGDEAEVRLAQQPRWAFEYSLGALGGVKARSSRSRHGAAPACIYLGEGAQLGYLPQAAAIALDWSSSEEEEDEDGDCDNCGGTGFERGRADGIKRRPCPYCADATALEIDAAAGHGPDYDTRDREGAEEPVAAFTELLDEFSALSRAEAANEPEGSGEGSEAEDPDPLAEDYPGQRISGPEDAPLRAASDKLEAQGPIGERAKGSR